MWAPGQPGIDSIDEARRDIVLERDEGDGVFTAAEGPFTSYRRTVVRDASGSGDGATETFDFHLSVPWFGWLYWLPMRRALQRRPRNDAMPWWSPPDRLDQRAASVMGLLAAASLIMRRLRSRVSCDKAREASITLNAAREAASCASSPASRK